MFHFSICSDLFSVIVSKVNQIRNSVVCFVACLVFIFCYALTTSRCNAFQQIFLNQKKSEFYGPYFETVLFLVTMYRLGLIRGVFRTLSYIHDNCFSENS